VKVRPFGHVDVGGLDVRRVAPLREAGVLPHVDIVEHVVVEHAGDDQPHLLHFAVAHGDFRPHIRAGQFLEPAADDRLV